MMAGLRRAQRRVDAAEQHVEIFGDQVSQSKDVRSLLHLKSSISQSAGIDVHAPPGIARAQK
jgi:hypothetical protein